MQICAVGAEDEIFEQVRPVFAGCEVCFIIIVPPFNACNQEFAAYHYFSAALLSGA